MFVCEVRKINQNSDFPLMDNCAYNKKDYSNTANNKMRRVNKIHYTINPAIDTMS